MSTKTNIARHIEALDTTGRYSAIYKLEGRIDFRRLSRHFKMITTRRHPDATYHLFWFLTGDSVTVCYSGNMFLLDAVDDFMNTATKLSIAGGVTEVVSGGNKELFKGFLNKRLSLFTPTPKQRSYGGSHLGK